MDAGASADTASGGHGDNALLPLVDNAVADRLIQAHVARVAATNPTDENDSAVVDALIDPAANVLSVALAALDAFLQANVTGPVLQAKHADFVEKSFLKAWRQAKPEDKDDTSALKKLRRACLRYLEVDGVSPYTHIPRLELFSLARSIVNEVLANASSDIIQIPSADGKPVKHSIAWTRLRVNVWHHKITTQPSLGAAANFTRSSQWSEIPTLATQIYDSMESLRANIIDSEVWATEETWSHEEKAQWLVESANNYILLGRQDKAKEALLEAARATGLVYSLSGALGKRTKFQVNDISQLVVLARSNDKSATNTAGTADDEEDDSPENAMPDALKLNNDTLLEEIHFAKEGTEDAAKADNLPPSLADLSPDNQPQLNPLDQIILLTEATIKDAFSPVDTLTSEEILPFAVRVLTDKSTNWQIYTQALLVRSRIEIHRSRTVERGVLQLQVLADQVLSDTTYSSEPLAEELKDRAESSDVPEIKVIEPGQASAPVKEEQPTTFLPAPKSSESAPAHVRLRYLHALSSPPRWHLESELAYSWVGVGSMVSALEIFKRLRLWAEVALCLASRAASEDEDGRGSGGDDKARGIIRWRLFHRTGTPQVLDFEPEDDIVDQDVTQLKAADFSGPERIPPPPNAARLWCILGDLEDTPAHYERAWEVSNSRYARAQKSLGEHYLQQKDMEKALDAYKKATAINRLNPDIWGRLGDISLRMGQFEDAAEAYSRSISTASDAAGGEGARTWSNLGSALWSLYSEVTAKEKDGESESKDETGNAEVHDDDVVAEEKSISRDPKSLLAQALAAYKKGASIAHDNWRIWDNVLTLGSRIQPAPVGDIVLALSNIIRIRKTEDALDAGFLGAVLQDVVLSKKNDISSGIYEPPRGSMERLVIRLLEEQVIPLITKRAELWALISRLRAWRRDYAGAIDATERAWRAAVGSSGSGGAGLLPGESASSGGADWTEDEAGWAETVKRTDELVSVLENWGSDVETIGSRWRTKARSAVRSVMGRAKTNWEGSEGWKTLEGLMEGLKVDKS